MPRTTSSFKPLPRKATPPPSRQDFLVRRRLGRGIPFKPPSTPTPSSSIRSPPTPRHIPALTYSIAAPPPLFIIVKSAASGPQPSRAIVPSPPRLSSRGGVSSGSMTLKATSINTTTGPSAASRFQSHLDAARPPPTLASRRHAPSSSPASSRPVPTHRDYRLGMGVVCINQRQGQQKLGARTRGRAREGSVRRQLRQLRQLGRERPVPV